MKQIVLLEDYEVARLNRGKQLEVMTPNGALVIGFDRHRPYTKNGVASTDSNVSTCKKCDRSFKSKHALAMHHRRKHGDLR